MIKQANYDSACRPYKETDEIQRVEKQIIKLKKQLERGQNQLQNQRYLAHAPKEVVEAVTRQVAQWQQDLDKFDAHLKVIHALDE